MSKVAVVYWSGTGNTEAMANAVADGARKAGATAEVFSVGDFSADKVSGYDALAWGRSARRWHKHENRAAGKVPCRLSRIGERSDDKDNKSDSGGLRHRRSGYAVYRSCKPKSIPLVYTECEAIR